MKIVNVQYTEIYKSVTDMLFDFVLTDGERLQDWSFLIEDLRTPQTFLQAVTTDHKAYTFFPIDLDTLDNEYNQTKEDVLIIVFKGEKPWCTVLLSQLQW